MASDWRYPPGEWDIPTLIYIPLQKNVPVVYICLKRNEAVTGPEMMKRKMYILKLLPKNLKYEDKIECIKRERDILVKITKAGNPPFLANLEDGRAFMNFAYHAEQYCILSKYYGIDLLKLYESLDSRRDSWGMVISTEDDYKFSFSCCVQIREGLKWLHDNNIFHIDVKPENITIDNKGHIRLIDFDHAQTTKEVSKLDMTRNMLYRSPKAIKYCYEEGESGPRLYTYTAEDDFFSLGSILVELVNRCFLDKLLVPLKLGQFGRDPDKGEVEGRKISSREKERRIELFVGNKNEQTPDLPKPFHELICKMLKMELVTDEEMSSIFTEVFGEDQGEDQGSYHKFMEKLKNYDIDIFTAYNINLKHILGDAANYSENMLTKLYYEEEEILKRERQVEEERREEAAAAAKAAAAANLRKEWGEERKQWQDTAPSWWEGAQVVRVQGKNFFAIKFKVLKDGAGSIPWTYDKLIGWVRETLQADRINNHPLWPPPRKPYRPDSQDMYRPWAQIERELKEYLKKIWLFVLTSSLSSTRGSALHTLKEFENIIGINLPRDCGGSQGVVGGGVMKSKRTRRNVKKYRTKKRRSKKRKKKHGGKKRKTNRRKTNRRKTNRRKTNRRKTLWIK